MEVEERINETFKEYLSTYQKPDWETRPGRGKRHDEDFVSGLVGILNNVPDNLRIAFDIVFPGKATGLTEELRERLLRAGAIQEGQSEATLVYMASRYGESLPFESQLGSTSGSRTAVMSLERRRVFSYQRSIDSFTDDVMISLGGQAYVSIDPTGQGHLTVSMGYELHNIPPYLMKGIKVTADQIPLTPVYNDYEKKPVRTEDFWQR